MNTLQSHGTNNPGQASNTYQIAALLGEFIFRHRNRSVIWEITGRCNCRCSMCNTWEEDLNPVSLDDAKRTVDFMHDHGVIFLQITGGEPTLYKDLVPLIAYINKKNFVLDLATNGTTMTEKLADNLRSAGLKYINISFDHFDPAIQDKIRGLRGEFDGAVAAVRILKRKGFNVYSSTMIDSYNWNQMDKLANFINSELGIKFGLCFPYPDFNMEKDNVSRLNRHQLIHALNDLLRLQHAGFKFANARSFLEDCLRFAKKEETRHPCLAGDIVFSVKGAGDFYPCWLRPKQFDISSGWNSVRIDCNRCHLSCFREISIMSSMVKSHPLMFFKEIAGLVR